MHPNTQDAIAAALTLGERPAFSRLLQAHLEQHPQDESAWLWLSQIADKPDLSAESLVHFLEIRAAQAALPAGSGALAKRLRRLADTVERPPRGPRARLQAALLWAWRGLLAGVLLVVALSIGPLALGYRPIIIISGSMEPIIHTGSIVVVQPVPSAGLQVGDVIAYMPGANAAIPIVHRIVSLRDEDDIRYYTTRGDANLADDPNEVPLGTTAWRYRYSVPLIGYIVTFASSPNGKIVMIALPLLGLAGLSVVDWLKRRPTATPVLRHPAPARTRPLAALAARLHRLALPALVGFRALPDRLRLSAQAAQGRLSTLPARLRVFMQPLRLRLSTGFARRRLSALSAVRALPTRLRLWAQPAMLHLHALPEHLRRRALPTLAILAEVAAQLNLAAQSALRELRVWLRPSVARARRELCEMRDLLRLPAPAARRELVALLGRSAQREWRTLLRLPALLQLRARLHLT